ncbi:MAG: UbiX family flavin prenyltransferase [Candidatus Hodarchaeota archaeon]
MVYKFTHRLEYKEGEVTGIRLIVGICGASGVQYGIELLKTLKEEKIETHLVLSEWAETVIQEETSYNASDLRVLADFSYGYFQMDAAIASSSFLVDGMIICPSTVATVSKIAIADTANLIVRAADNMLKMHKPLVVAIRETPLSPPCLKNLYELATSGAIVIPLAPGFYHMPKNIDELIAFMVGKILDALGIPNQKYKRWK